MAADWAGCAPSSSSRSSARPPPVNLYLPEYAAYITSIDLQSDRDRHHHIESIHLSATRGRALHPALAIVQTPARAYWVLRVNGLEVGCEEDGGVAKVWMSLLNCDADGVVSADI
jgi:hypothetical protein